MFRYCVCVCLLVLYTRSSEGIFLVIPEDVATGFAAIYGFSPRILKANDHRLGFGFRFGNHADLQVLYEFGPQAYTRPIQPIKVRSATYRERVVRRRRPILDFLFRSGLLHEAAVELNIADADYDQPR